VQKLARLLVTAVILVAVWGTYSRHRVKAPRAAPEARRPESQGEPSGSREFQFRCDGRTYCSQMTSCAEAKYFLMHCPDVKVDGDHDGIPCERQWCPGG